MHATAIGQKTLGGKQQRKEMLMERYLSKWILWLYVIPFLSSAAVLAALSLFGVAQIWRYVPLAVVVAFIAATIVIIPERNVHVIELLGSYWCTWRSGIHIRVPVVMRVRNRIFTGDQIAKLSFDGETQSSDGKIRSLVDVEDDSVRVKAEITFRVSGEYAEGGQKDDAYKATYEIGTDASDYINAVITVVETHIRAAFGGKSLKEVLVVDKGFVESIRSQCAWMKEQWGVELKTLFIRDIELKPETVELRQKRLEAKVNAEATVTTAEGNRDANKLRGIGEGQRIKNAMDKSGITDPEVIAGINLQRDQYEAVKGSTIFITTGSDGSFDLGGATAKIETVLGKIRGKKQKRTTTNKGE